MRPVTEWFLYKHRYRVGYALLATAVGLYLLLHTSLVPPGLGASESASIITAAHISLTELPTNIVDLPYLLVQKFSVMFLGVTPLGVRLPSLIFGGLTALCLMFLLKRWFPRNIAMLAAIIALTSAWFIGTARLGTPVIMVPFWTSLILLAATFISQQTPHWKWWKVVLAFAAALSLYTPFMGYIFAAALVAGFSQPHLRYLIRKSTSFHMTLGTALFLLILAPLGWGLYKNPGQAWQLLAVPSNLPGPLQFGQDFLQALSNIFNPYNISFGEFATPLLGLATIALLLLGGLRLLKDFHAVRSHVLLIWLAILVPIIGFNPQNLAVLMVPAFLATAIGLQLIIRYWYRLFPRNPYARVFGLLPLCLLLLSIVQFNDQRYTYGMAYSAQAHNTFSSDAFLIQQKLASTPEGSITLVVPQTQRDLYNIVATGRPLTTVVSGADATFAAGATYIVSLEESNQLATQPGIPTTAIVNAHKETGARFFVYQR